MEPTNPALDKSVPSKPVAGLVVILFIATIIGGWLYVDTVRNELEARLQALEARQAIQDVSRPVGGRLMAPTVENGWHRAVSSTHDYALMLPPGYHFLEGSEEERLAYVLPDPNENDDNPLPVMTIAARPTAAAETHPGKMIQAGSTSYWLSLYENLEWGPYDQVVASFQLL